MNYTRMLILALAACCLSAFGAEFKDGPVIFGFGKHSAVNSDLALSKSTRLKVVFDVYKQAETGKFNRNINSVARFLNMNVESGVPLENIELAVIVHGRAGVDLLNEKAFESRFDSVNPSQHLIAKLLKNNVKIYMCGQSANYDAIAKEELLEGVEMSLSAMTAHALLAQKGYSLNPF